MSEKLDAKFVGDIYKIKNGEKLDEGEWIVFLAQDNAFAAIFPAYIAKCVELGADEEQTHALLRMHGRLLARRAARPEKNKTPDAKGEILLDKQDPLP